MVKVYLKYMYGFLILVFMITGTDILNKMLPQESVTALEFALRAAGNNRVELEKVLRRYHANAVDSLKYAAACFLIENMPFYTYSESEQLENYKSYYIWLKETRSRSFEQLADSVRQLFGPIDRMQQKRDILEVDSAYLCHNIDWAFKVWHEQPWGKNVSFETFCEYLLPYRIGDEPLTYWREMYYEKYNSMLDSLRSSDSLDCEDPFVVAEYLRDRLQDNSSFYTSVSPFPFGHIGPHYVQYQVGRCQDLTDFEIYLFRALGIPCATDFLPLRGHTNAGHFWVVTWDKNGEEYTSDFMGKLEKIHKSALYNDDFSPKIYRYTFSVNRELHKQMTAYGEEVYPFWNFPKFIDVTSTYGHSFSKELSIPLERQYHDKRKGRIAYLCASRRDNWVPVDWAEYDARHLIFRNVRNGAVMRVATIENGLLTFLTDPFYIDRQSGKVHYCTAGTGKQKVVLYAKCDFGGEDLFRERMLGGIFEGSNRPDFVDADTLYIITDVPARLNTVAGSYSDKAYRYLRYKGPADSHCNVAEIAFYEKGDTASVKGKPIGTPGCFYNDGTHEYMNAFDGKTWTSFDYSHPSGGWAGLDLGRKACIDHIVYTPRNRDNYIRPGDVYELFYCDHHWKSAGTVKAASDSLVFCGIPENALLFLRNHTRGVDERIFSYENGIQLWK